MNYGVRNADRCGDDWCTAKKEIAELKEKVRVIRDALHCICRNIYEVWAGSEGIPEPETAAEAYLLRLIEQMRDEAKGGLG